MNCEKIRTEIETGARHEPRSTAVREHLVACAGCRGWADETDSLLSMLRDVPRVQAPADFDLRLRARLAVAREERRGWRAPLAAFWSRGFAWSQAAPALAAVALVATFTTLYVTRDRQPAPAGEQTVVRHAPEPAPAPTAPGGDSAVGPPRTVSPPAAKGAVRAVEARPLMAKAAPPESAPAVVAGTPILLGARAGRPVLTISEVTYGAQRAVTQRAVARQAASQGPESPVETIF